MSAAKTAEEKLRPCVNADKGCTAITRPARMLPLASIKTTIRQGGGRCSGCYAKDRRAEAAAAAPRITKRPDPAQLEEQRIKHAAAGLDRMLAERRDRMMRRGRVSA